MCYNNTVMSNFLAISASRYETINLALHLFGKHFFFIFVLRSSINQKKANRQSKKKERGGNSNTTRIYTRKLPVSQLKRVGQRPCVMTRMDASACLRDGARCELSNHTVVVQSKIKERIIKEIIFLLILSL